MEREKYVKELAEFIWDQTYMYDDKMILELAELLYEEGYRKQSEGEWLAKKPMIRSPYARNYYCSECKYEPIEVKSFCPTAVRRCEVVNDRKNSSYCFP